MAYDLTDKLVIGISSRALFNLELENRLFQEGVASENGKYCTLSQSARTSATERQRPDLFGVPA
jgi:hypothetical protein